MAIKNTGNVALHDIVINDPFLGGTVSGLPATLAVGGQALVQINYFLTQADVDAGRVDNAATGTALDPFNNVVNAMTHYDLLP